VSTVTGKFKIVNELGLHARAATKLVRVADKYKSEVQLEKDGQVANAKSVMGVLLLCGAKGTYVVVRADGNDAEDALREIGELINNKFGEDR
jgi:phosphocarrier protein HPr